jgi:hypothetical protein
MLTNIHTHDISVGLKKTEGGGGRERERESERDLELSRNIEARTDDSRCIAHAHLLAPAEFRLGFRV